MKLKEKLAREKAKISFTAQGQADIAYGFREGWDAAIEWAAQNAKLNKCDCVRQLCTGNCHYIDDDSILIGKDVQE